MNRKTVTVPLASLAFATAAHAQTSPWLRAIAHVRGTALDSYNNVQDTGYVTSPPGPLSISASGQSIGGGCSASSTAQSTASFGLLAMQGSGSGNNCASSAATIYTDADPSGPEAYDRLTVVSSALPTGTRVRIRVRASVSHQCTSVQPYSAPYCGVTAVFMLGGSYGSLNFFPTAAGLYEHEGDIAVVGDVMTMHTYLRPYAGASTTTLGPPNGPAHSVSCSVDSSMTYFVEPVDPRVTLIAESGHHYAFVPVCDPIDFNNDGVSPDTDDLIDFLSVYGGGPCSNDPLCNDIDFNNDGVSPDSEDIAAFMRVFGGGSCA
jgi:hypothetical protein